MEIPSHQRTWNFTGTVPSFQGHVLSSRSGRRSGRTPGFDYVTSKFLGYLSISVFRGPTEWWVSCWFPFPHEKRGNYPKRRNTPAYLPDASFRCCMCGCPKRKPQRGSPGSEAGCIRPTGPLATCETLNSLVSRKARRRGPAGKCQPILNQERPIVNNKSVRQGFVPGFMSGFSSAFDNESHQSNRWLLTEAAMLALNLKPPSAG